MSSVPDKIPKIADARGNDGACEPWGPKAVRIKAIVPAEIAPARAILSPVLDGMSGATRFGFGIL